MAALSESVGNWKEDRDIGAGRGAAEMGTVSPPQTPVPMVYRLVLYEFPL